MISVVIRNKNQEEALEFLLKNLSERYAQDIDEILVIDNSSTDKSREVASRYGARFETIENFSYGGSANFAASKAINEYIVIFSAHSYPVSPDFFVTIRSMFDKDPLLAGLRCLHNQNDYHNYIKGITVNEDPNKSGVIFSGSAFRKSIWKEYPFKEDVPTFEDKEWTLRIIKTKYKIEFAPVVFNYQIKRSKKQYFFRFKNDLKGNHEIWGQRPSYRNVFNSLFGSIYRIISRGLVDVFYAFKRFFYSLNFLFKTKGTK